LIKLAILLALLSSHSVTLTWTGSGTGYNVYRGTVSGGPYPKLNPTPIIPQTYTDSSVASGTTYYYVVTAINRTESKYSNEQVAIIPAAPLGITCTAYSTSTQSNACIVTGVPANSSVQVCVAGNPCAAATRTN
jgi:fibronectin type 3 domain-containing protein